MRFGDCCTCHRSSYRIGQQIRDLTVTGHVELDEVYVGDRRSGGKRGRGAPGKTIVMGLVSGEGPMMAVVIPNVKRTRCATSCWTT